MYLERCWIVLVSSIHFYTFLNIFYDTVDAKQPPGMVLKPRKSWDKLPYQPVSLPDFERTINSMGVNPKIGVPQNGWFISWKTLLKWMIWGYPYFWKHLYFYPFWQVLFHPFERIKIPSPQCCGGGLSPYKSRFVVKTAAWYQESTCVKHISIYRLDIIIIVIYIYIYVLLWY